MEKYTEKRPWGLFEQYLENKTCTVKILFINPNQAVSLQYHNKRDEFWKVLKGRPKITLGNKVVKAKQGDEFFIPKKVKHRIEAGKEKTEVLEISLGKFNEKDEVRLEDKYNRD